MYYRVNSINKEIFFVDAMVNILGAERLFRIKHHLGSRDKANCGSNIWFLKGLFGRQDSLVCIYFRLYAFERDSLLVFCVFFFMGSDMYWGE